MSKVTTDQCKKFLAHELENNQQVLHDVFKPSKDDPLATEDFEMALAASKVSKNWKRDLKFNANGTSEHACYFYALWYPEWGPERGTFDAEDLTTVRQFSLDYKGDQKLSFYVLEDKEGDLYLGEYMGYCE